MTDPFELDDKWINAFSALGSIRLTVGKDGKFDGGAIAESDVQPIVDLLLSDAPMPQSARERLAELLSPGDPPMNN